MKLREIYSQDFKTTGMLCSDKSPVISYEVFPPNDDVDGKKLDSLFCELEKLKEFNPALISVTYGAGGSNQNESVGIIKRIKEELKITPMPHFTCVSTSEANIKTYLNTIEEIGVENILALRGDIPENNEICHDFQFASELVGCIKSESNLSVAVAGYPECHKECDSLKKDIEFLKKKVDMGADVIYTQLFFNNEHYFSFVQMCSDVGINVPIMPGILPVTGFNQLEKMASLCNVDVPKSFAQKLEAHKDDKDYVKKCGLDFASTQCQQLVESGVKGLHFYTLNKAFATSEILNNIL